jgi:hypothetical protein
MPKTPAPINDAIGQYLSGYADGEGSFCVSFSPRPTLYTRLEVRPSFSVSQHMHRTEVLEIFKNTFRCGTIRPNPSDHTYKYEVRSIRDLVEKVIPHFKRYPLLSSKQKEVEKFSYICDLIAHKKHHNPLIVREIVMLSYTMNGLGARRYDRETVLSFIV